MLLFFLSFFPFCLIFILNNNNNNNNKTTTARSTTTRSSTKTSPTSLKILALAHCSIWQFLQALSGFNPNPNAMFFHARIHIHIHIHIPPIPIHIHIHIHIHIILYIYIYNTVHMITHLFCNYPSKEDTMHLERQFGLKFSMHLRSLFSELRFCRVRL